MPEVPDSNTPGDADETGEALAPFLAEIEDPASAEFIGRVRRSIHRRAALAQFSSFGWRMPGAILSELLRVLGYLPGSLGRGPGRWK